MSCIKLQLSLYYQDKKKPHFFGFFYFFRLARRLAETELPIPPTSRSVCGQAPPEPGASPAAERGLRPGLPPGSLTTSTRAGEGEAERRGEHSTPLPEGLPEPLPLLPLQAAYGRPPHKSRGSSGPSPYPRLRCFSGVLSHADSRLTHRAAVGLAAGDSTPQDGGDGGGVLLSAHDPTGWEGARRKIRRGSPLPPTENQNPLERGSCLLSSAINFCHRQTTVAQSLCYRPVKVFRIPRRAHPVPPI